MTSPTATPRRGQQDARARFQRLAGEWKARSRHLSNSVQMAMLKPYQAIIGMGWEAVPYLWKS